MIMPKAQKAAERQHGIAGLAAPFVHHEVGDVAEPFPFEEEYARSLVKPLHGSIDVRFVSITTLIDMKTAVGRQQDLIDVEHLRMRVDSDAGK